MFYQGTYAQALNDSKLELRFLIVYLHSENQDCASFCRSVIVPSTNIVFLLNFENKNLAFPFTVRNTLTSQEMVDFLNSHAVIFWSCAVETGEGRRVVHALHAKTYPFIGVIILRDNVMTLVARY